MLRVSSETVKTFDVCGNKSVVSFIEKTIHVQQLTFNLHGVLYQISIILDSLGDGSAPARIWVMT